MGPGGLKYQWQTNALRTCVEAVGKDVHYKNEVVDKLYPNAIIGPEDGSFGKDGVGVYKLMEPQP